MIRILALLAALMLSACAHKPPAIYGSGDPGIIVHGQQHWVGNPTPAEKHDWEVFHLHPSFDENEVKALARMRYSMYGDGVSTLAGLLTCAAIKESNPLGLWLIPANFLAYKIIKSDLERTSRYTTTVTMPYVVTGTRAAVILWNVSVIARCW